MFWLVLRCFFILNLIIHRFIIASTPVRSIIQSLPLMLVSSLGVPGPLYICTLYSYDWWLNWRKSIMLCLPLLKNPSFFKTCYRPSVPGGSSDTLYYYQPRVSPTSKTLSLENVYNLGQLRGFVPLFQWNFNSGGKNKRYLKLVALLCQIWILLPCALCVTSEAHFTIIFIHHQLQMQSTSKHH